MARLEVVDGSRVKSRSAWGASRIAAGGASRGDAWGASRVAG
ncbi:MAG TPA: hypothetical protein VFJ22_03300 [Dermatophilaceae bacterium]|nr:hypothetical protein [Dermatophilaceae bacterium]